MSKAFHTQAQAKGYAAKLYIDLNSGVLVGLMSIPLKDAITEYLDRYDTQGYSKTSKVEAKMTLDRLLAQTGQIKTGHLTQRHLDSYLRKRREDGVSGWTINKCVNNLRAFLHWASDQNRRYLSEQLRLTKVKVAPIVTKALTTSQIKTILAASASQEWKVRVLLSLTTGLRSKDLDRLSRGLLDIEAMTVHTTSQKTGKQFLDRPIPTALSKMLKDYVATLTGEKLFPGKNVRKEWDALRIKAKMPDLTRQDFRKTFSTLIQMIGSGGSNQAKAFLEHADSRTTTEFYTDRQAIQRWYCEQLPVKDWLS